MESEKSASELYANDLKKFIEKFGNYWYCSIVDTYVDIKNESIRSLEDTNYLYSKNINIDKIEQECVKTTKDFNEKITVDEYHKRYCKFDDKIGWIYNYEDEVLEDKPIGKLDELLSQYILENGNRWYFDLIESYVPFFELEIYAFDEVNKYMLHDFDPRKEKQDTVITMINTDNKELNLKEYRTKYCKFDLEKNEWTYCPDWKQSWLDIVRNKEDVELNSSESEEEIDEEIFKKDDELTDNIFKLIVKKNLLIKKVDDSTEEEESDDEKKSCFCVSCNADDKDKYLDQILDSVDIPEINKDYNVLLD